MAYNISIWPGSGSFFPGDTPYGFYDDDGDFQIDIEAAASWAGIRLGHYIQDVELIDKHFYAAYEEAVNEYGYYVNTYAAKDVLLTILGLPSTDLNLTQKYVPPSSVSLFALANDYANMAGVGGSLTHYTGSITLEPGKQYYDLKSLPSGKISLETGSFNTNKRFIIRSVFHELPASIVRYFDPYVPGGMMGDSVVNQFGWGKFSPASNYLLTPVSWDVMRMQAIEFNDLIRKSGYSFKLTNDRLQIFPVPRETMRLWFTYTFEDSSILDSINNYNSNDDAISDISNVPYFNVTYSKINDIGRNWIRNYFLAICKETLGRIRGKYSSLPIPDNEISLNYQELLQESTTEKESLRTELKEYLDSFSSQKQLEKKAAEAQSLQDVLKYVPTKIYVW